MPSLDDGLTAALRFFWHPVCTLHELAATPSGVGPVQVTLLGEELAVAMGASGPLALSNRCVHRSARLSVGTVDGDSLRCAYHGWCYSRSGACTDIPALGPSAVIPPRARVGGYSSQVAHGLVWVCLDDRADVPLPACPAWGDPTLKVLEGEPYTWTTSAPRRVENFVDLSHFAFVHDGSLGRRDQPVPPIPDITREHAELRFTYDPPELDAESTALYGFSDYRMPVPLSVAIEFRMPGDVRRLLWMTASPVTSGTCRTFWLVARSDDLDGDDEAHMAFQRRILAEDEPVVTNQMPAELPLDNITELSVRTDKVSIEYRRWLRDVVEVAADGPAAVRAALGLPQAVTV